MEKIITCSFFKVHIEVQGGGGRRHEPFMYIKYIRARLRTLPTIYFSQFGALDFYLSPEAFDFECIGTCPQVLGWKYIINQDIIRHNSYYLKNTDIDI